LNVLKSQKIIHRDLKPGNILIEKNGNPVIIDFGISVKIVSENQKFQICGSPGFIAPEIIVQK
jgi:serine/threonine protein kinase